MNRIPILLFYESAARELDVACLLRHYLRQRHGLELQLAQWPVQRSWALAHYQPEVVVVPFIYNTSADFYPFLYDWREATIFNCAWEQLFYSGNQEAKLPRGEFETKHVLHHAWGDFFAEILRGRGVPDSSIFVNGNLAYALYNEPYRAHFTHREQLAARYGLQAEKTWLFFPENYNWAFYPEEMLGYFIKSGIPEPTVREMVRYCRESLAAVLQWLDDACEPGRVEVILRPRPITSVSAFRSQVAELGARPRENVHFIKHGSVREWILAADQVVSSYSTCLIEAAVAGKPAAMLEPTPLPESLHVAWHDEAARVRSAGDLAQLGAADSPPDRLGVWARNQMLGRGDPIVRLADYLADLVAGRANRPMPAPAASLVPGEQARWQRTLWFEARRLSGYRRRRLEMVHLKDVYVRDVTTQQDIDLCEERWSKTLQAAKWGLTQARGPRLVGAAG